MTTLQGTTTFESNIAIRFLNAISDICSSGVLDLTEENIETLFRTTRNDLQAAREVIAKGGTFEISDESLFRILSVIYTVGLADALTQNGDKIIDTMNISISNRYFSGQSIREKLLHVDHTIISLGELAEYIEANIDNILNNRSNQI